MNTTASSTFGGIIRIETYGLTRRRREWMPDCAFGRFLLMKKQKIIDECEWMLSESAKNDTRLNPIDKNILAILQFIEDGKSTDADGFFRIILQDKGTDTSLQKYLEEFGVKVDYTTITRSINKLERLRYIDYLKGWWNQLTNQGQTPRIRLLNGTVNLIASKSMDCSDIATVSTKNDWNCNNQITGDSSESYSDIASAYEKEKKKENNKESNYSYSDIKLEVRESDKNESDLSSGKETTFLNGGNVEPGGQTKSQTSEIENIGQFLYENICSEKVMGDLLEWCIKNGWFTCDIQIERIVIGLAKKCPEMELNKDYYLEMFRSCEKKHQKK